MMVQIIAAIEADRPGRLGRHTACDDLAVLDWPS
jgi:hypothetical protein